MQEVGVELRVSKRRLPLGRSPLLASQVTSKQLTRWHGWCPA